MNYTKIIKSVEEIALANGRNPNEITLVAVSKGQTISNIEYVYHEGCRNFGENRIQEALEKFNSLPADIFWHFIGTLQKNKITKAIGKFSLIHSVDSIDLANKISNDSLLSQTQTPVLLQINTSGEQTKHGLAGDEWRDALLGLLELRGIKIKGLMTIAPLTEDKSQIRNCFRRLRLLRDQFVSLSAQASDIIHLSMGMTHDYKIAIEEGATILRIGTAIFKA